LILHLIYDKISFIKVQYVEESGEIPERVRRRKWKKLFRSLPQKEKTIEHYV
jgi:hypothetical protein